MKILNILVSRYHIYLLIIILCASGHSVFAQSSTQEALKAFSNCLCENRHQLEVRDLKDFYRIRGIPGQCCQSLAAHLIPDKLKNSVKGLDNRNCRINAFFVSEGISDPHTHPLNFVSYVVSGGYTHTIYEEAGHSEYKNSSCISNSKHVCTQHSQIDTKTDTIQKLGTTKLTEVYKESFVNGDLIAFINSQTIHRMDEFIPGTLTINFISNVGNRKIDVFISNETPDRIVLSKEDTRTPVKKEIASDVIDKSLMILKSELQPKEHLKVHFVPQL